MERKNVLRLDAGEARYEIMAECTPCPEAGGASRASLPGGDPCSNLCAPLAGGLAAAQRRVNEAAARVQDLAGKANALQIQVASDRQDLAGAEAARSKPRAVLEKISALQARIKAGQEELERLRQASEDATRVLAALRRVADDTGSADARCRTQCQAPPARPERAAAASTGAEKHGGGARTAVLVAGGAALAAGGAVALAGGGGSDAPPAATDFSGLWRGTKIVLTDQGTPIECRRVFAEDWQISQSGSSLDIAVATTVTDCGSATCPTTAGCLSSPGSFPRRHVGTAAGSTAFVYPILDYQTPSCTLPMMLQASTMRGSMPACVTDQPLPTAMDVVMQRVGR